MDPTNPDSQHCLYPLTQLDYIVTFGIWHCCWRLGDSSTFSQKQITVDFGVTSHSPCRTIRIKKQVSLKSYDTFLLIAKPLSDTS